MMQRESSISGTDQYDFATSLYPSILRSYHSPLLDDYLNDVVASSVSTSTATEASLSSYWTQIELHRDLVDRHQTILAHLRDVAEQAHTLRQENINLKMANLDLNNRLNSLLGTTPFRGVGLGLGLEEEGSGTSEKSPTSVMDTGRVVPERVKLPKSISVRSSGYLKAGKGGDCVRASNRNRVDNETQKVYVKGGKKEQPLELEVYNQGMTKTELCNKWQQTGTCPYGDNCQFAHSVDELRPVLRHPRYKTEVCRMVLNGVPCPYGHRCHFRHSLTDEEQLTRAMNSKSLETLSYR